ncbi:MAG TPA: GNAT family N-acetyltransferase [Candidatus Binatus sp.]|uniref:GNAT family N-acetyltransferase n=1 Tax=Candidatus Binatus sp. TaxID=2811406 RepID=UPI002B47EEDB|nr:GNAT family N-acetyltransferase [Candidatus Binatus sp.]HKN11684.1 GNAT family N-acetyltransferase [Candidatus Binatus sp.]
MAIRKHRAGELVIEQTRDFGVVRAMLARGGLMTDGIEWPAACYIVAYVGDAAVGVIGVESKIDAALIRSLYVNESMRRRGIGGALLAAARKAAHTRGARHLYLFSIGAGEFFERHGFKMVAVDEVIVAIPGIPQVEYYRARPEELAREAAYHLDVSGDGVIER